MEKAGARTVPVDMIPSGDDTMNVPFSPLTVV